jgi:hypothetical protein
LETTTTKAEAKCGNAAVEKLSNDLPAWRRQVTASDYPELPKT